MKMNANQSVLLVVDLQERMLPHIQDSESVCSHTAWLMDIAHHLNVPVLMTEQYPKGLGLTVPALRARMKPENILEKTHFSAVSEGNLLTHAQADRDQWVLVGTETHVCVQQTALDLIEQGKQVYLVQEAVTSRKAHDKNLALSRLQALGAQLVSREMVAFEWLQKANTPEFRELLGKFIR
ncbi:MAG: isochorismatase family protein [Alcaligenaceae bacterium]|nr:isochorismatase family protein [Alcaligenaceae bacterium]